MTNSIHFKRLITIAAIIFSVMFTTITLAGENTPFPKILVSGQGSVDIAPDMAILSLTVTREADTARGALDANSR